jgi:hypothetical protein
MFTCSVCKKQDDYLSYAEVSKHIVHHKIIGTVHRFINHLFVPETIPLQNVQLERYLRVMCLISMQTILV